MRPAPRKGGAAAKARGVPPASRPDINLAESPISWLARRRDKDGQPLISEEEFNAGERLRADFWFPQMTPRVTANWDATASSASQRRSAPGTGSDVQDSVIAAAERVRRALAAVGPELAGVLIDVCCHLKGLEEAERRAGWPQRCGKIVLRLALTSLARHYGLIRGEAAGPRPAAGRVRHWGAEGYRPVISDGSG
jgi:hypothetical protein